MLLENCNYASSAPSSSASSSMWDTQTNMTGNMWPCFATEYDQIAKIEQGQFSEVWSGVCKPIKQKVCIKIMDLEKISTSFEDILQEVQAMRLCDDPNILNCYCSFVHHDQLWLITQFMNKGSCLRVMSISKQLNLGEGLEEECIGFILSETLKGLHYLHQRGYVHRDVKCGNILLDESGSVRLSDFGVNRWTMTTSATGHTVSTSICHAAPETIEGDNFDDRIDIWSLGITALELAKGYSPYSHHSAAKTTQLILEGDPPSLKNYPHDKQLHSGGVPFSKFFEDFYKRCLQKNSRLRPSSTELLKNKFLRNRTPARLISFLANIYDVDSAVQQQIQYSSIGNTLQDFEDLVDETSVIPHQIPVAAYITTIDVDKKDSKMENSLIPAPEHSSFVPGTSWVFDIEDNLRRKNVAENVTQQTVGRKQHDEHQESIEDFLKEFDQNDATM